MQLLNYLTLSVVVPPVVVKVIFQLFKINKMISTISETIWEILEKQLIWNTILNKIKNGKNLQVLASDNSNRHSNK